ncbi:orotate phosphoribosyltransferase [Thermodesulfobacterium thermophilum]|uniref:orotate phosphoribosyltransferase n=1 Tax=Thermodesulfobacterium thermophilum TaxID=886 RepID=UPI0003B32636|nr:orotate phosphoribosyltransferase [Thermodesulfobacterium thermophilum]
MEKRQFTRIPIPVDVEFLIGNASYSAKIKDISYGGVFLESDFCPDLDKEVVLVLFLSPEVKIFIKGIVVRTVPGQGFGIKFTYISPESFEHLKNLIYYNLPSEDKAFKELRRFLGKAHPLVQSVIEICIKAKRDALLEFILERAFLYSPDKPFVLASGKESPYYLDCRKVTLYSKSFELIGCAFWQEIRFLGVDGVAGMSIGADPIVCAVLSKAQEEDYPLEGLLIRKEPKKYGTSKQIEGNVSPGMEVVLVEDVVTTGGSVIKAIEALEKENIKIVKVMALVDREEGGKEKIEEKGYEFMPIFTFSEIIKAYERKMQGVSL